MNWTDTEDDRLPTRVLGALKRAAEKYETTPATILNGSRRPHVCRARHQVCCELKQAGYSLPRIARYLKYRHHSAVMAALRGGRAAWDAERERRRRLEKQWEPDYSGEWAI